MSLLQQAYETYQTFAHKAGIEESGLEVLVPIGHGITTANIEITLSADGQFLSARSLDKGKDSKFIFPVTEESSGRTSGKQPHPLCDNLGYISPADADKHTKYINLLSAWESSPFSHPILTAVLQYVRQGTVIQDLKRQQLLKVKANGELDSDKQFVRWIVFGLPDTENCECWRNQALIHAWIQYQSLNLAGAEQDMCMVTGQMLPAAKQHAKGIIPINGNAKLISANDDSGFTFRGRFINDRQAASVSYIASQKAHNALRWIIANQGSLIVTSQKGSDDSDANSEDNQSVTIAGRTFIAWNPHGYRIPKIAHPFMRYSKNSDPPAVTLTEYQRRLDDALKKCQTEIPTTESVVIAAFDAATTGRLAVTYYNELHASDFFQRLKTWDEQCCWFGGNRVIRSPSLRQIVECAFGTERGNFIETDERLLAQQLQRLIVCRLDNGRMPTYIVQSLVQKASSPLHYSKRSNYHKVLNTACAVLRKYRLDTKKEVWDMALDAEKRDRSYQFGRLLAIFEKMEQDVLSSHEEDRLTNAIRMQAVFCQRPHYAARRIFDQLNQAYISRLKPFQRNWYHKLIGDIYAILSECPDSDSNRPLDDTYLMGYYLQRNELYKSRKNKEDAENDTVEEN